MYTPPQHIIENYAKVLIRFALNGGKGLKRGEVVYLVGTETTKLLFEACRREIYRVGGHVIAGYMPAESDRYQTKRDFYELAKPHQLDFFPEHYYRGLVSEMDHMVYLKSEDAPHALDGIDPKKIMRHERTMRPFMDWRFEREERGELTWTLCMYPTEANAREAGLSLKAYWRELITACYLNEGDPVAAWRAAQKKMRAIKRMLDRITQKTERFHVKADAVDLWITPGAQRQWLTGSGRNIPSFEHFLSPDWRGTEGYIAFDLPLYRYGHIVEGIELWFEEGRVIKSRAKRNEQVLKEMIKTENADKVGEFSLTDRRLSRISKFMATTLFDENYGGRWGNTHIALGKAYRDSLDGDPAALAPDEWEHLGFNTSSVHTDLFSTTKRTVTAHLTDGSERTIYNNGEFTL